MEGLDWKISRLMRLLEEELRVQRKYAVQKEAFQNQARHLSSLIQTTKKLLKKSRPTLPPETRQ